MQKLIHITDPHVVPCGASLFGIDPAQRLRDTLSHVERVHGDAAAIVLTGDLTDNGEPEAYELLKQIVAEISLPVYLTLGNHDSRDAFREVFGGHGFVQTAFDLGDWTVILLDTKDEAGEYGSLDGGRLDWLSACLKNVANRPVVLGMHHPPFDLHMPSFSRNRLESKAFLDLLRDHTNVRHMLLGHLHVATSGRLGNTSFSVSRGTAQHIAVDFEQRGRSAFVAASPAYDIVFLTGDSVVVHRSEGLDGLPIIRPADPK